jgi:glutathione reductase (NADPH)
VGAGYIAVELAGILNALGSDVHLAIRHQMFLRTFDSILRETLFEEMKTAGVHLVTDVVAKQVELVNSKKTVHFSNGYSIGDVDVVLWAIGMIQSLKLLSFCQGEHPWWTST